ncbi:hypothetical protein GBAR_LOCUS15826 [Geodia barretti]|uniref:Uncharacterized protein n=1 Tax=Geodia barretti TaxID=519541 RepID=A0AA35SE81_GEOBA|nr:hypothetical protein GBAR_LOCUS15826 [Geodia barretti]
MFYSQIQRAGRGQLVQLISELNCERELLGEHVLDVRVCASPGQRHECGREAGEERGGSGGRQPERRRGRKRAAHSERGGGAGLHYPQERSRRSPRQGRIYIKTFPEIFSRAGEAVKLLRGWSCSLIL